MLMIKRTCDVPLKDRRTVEELRKPVGPEPNTTDPVG